MRRQIYAVPINNTYIHWEREELFIISLYNKYYLKPGLLTRFWHSAHNCQWIVKLLKKLSQTPCTIYMDTDQI